MIWPLFSLPPIFWSLPTTLLCWLCSSGEAEFGIAHPSKELKNSKAVKVRVRAGEAYLSHKLLDLACHPNPEWNEAICASLLLGSTGCCDHGRAQFPLVWLQTAAWGLGEMGKLPFTWSSGTVIWPKGSLFTKQGESYGPSSLEPEDKSESS